MRTPKQTSSTRLAATVCLATILAACSSERPQEPETENLANETAALPSIPIVDPPFSRTRLLLTVARAASSHSAGTDDAGSQRMLDGRQFEVRLRFGCDGQGPNPSDRGWSVDPDGRILRLRAVPTLSLADEIVESVAGDGIEAAEGFWLSRPWLLHAACPGASGETAAAAAREASESSSNGDEETTSQSDRTTYANQRIGIAQFFTSDDARTGRRIDRPFEAVKQLKSGDRVGLQGFNLVLSGRLRARANGRVILCAGSGRDRPPDCIVSVELDRVWMERPEDNAVMAEWTV